MPTPSVIFIVTSLTCPNANSRHLRLLNFRLLKALISKGFKVGKSGVGTFGHQEPHFLEAWWCTPHR